MFHIVSLNGVDSGNAVTLLCLPSFQSEVWPAVLVVLWTGADWAAGAAEAVRLSHVGFLPPLLRSRDVHVAGSVLLCFSACRGATSLVDCTLMTLSHFLKGWSFWLNIQAWVWTFFAILWCLFTFFPWVGWENWYYLSVSNRRLSIKTGNSLRGSVWRQQNQLFIRSSQINMLHLLSCIQLAHNHLQIQEVTPYGT